jgi:hypothetical protein
MKRNEFIIGMIIISIFVIVSMVIGISPIRTEPKVTVTQVYTIDVDTDEDGNVDVEVK